MTGFYCCYFFFLLKNYYKTVKSSFSNLKKKFLLWEILNTYKSKENNTMNPPIPITPLQQNA